MTAQYWVLISDELMAAGPDWPDGMRAAPVPAPRSGAASVTEPPGMSWYLIEDDTAPAHLAGCKVELVFRTEHGQAVVTERRVLPLWMTSAGAWAACCTGCSGRSPSWLPPWPCSAA